MGKGRGVGGKLRSLGGAYKVFCASRVRYLEANYTFFQGLVAPLVLGLNEFCMIQFCCMDHWQQKKLFTKFA